MPEKNITKVGVGVMIGKMAKYFSVNERANTDMVNILFLEDTSKCWSHLKMLCAEKL